MPIRKTSWWKEKKPKGWLSHNSLSRVRLSVRNGQPIKVGEGYRKIAYHGFAFFKNGDRVSKVPVVIKKFKEEISQERADEYNKLISFLRKNKFPIPRSGLIRVTKEMELELNNIVKQGDYIAIQQFFGKGTKTHIVDRNKEVDRMLKKFRKKTHILGQHTDFSFLFLGKKLARTDAALIFAKMINLKILPKFDVVAPLNIKGKYRGAIPFDLDLIIEEITQRKTPSNAELAVRMLEILNSITPNNKERLRLYNIVLKEVKAKEIKANLELFKNSILLTNNKELENNDFFPT